MKKNLFLLMLILCFQVTILYSQSIVSVTPNKVNNGDSLNVTVIGVHTHFTHAIYGGISFYFYDAFGGFINVVNDYTIISDDTIMFTIIVPQNCTQGYKDLMVFDTTDITHPLKYGKVSAIFVNNPKGSYAQITGFTPNRAKLNQALEVTITGANTDFHSFIGFTSTGDYSFTDYNNNTGDIFVDSISVLSNTSMTLDLFIPPYAHQGWYNFMADDESKINGVKYYNSYGKFNAIYITAPTNPEIISLTPNHALNDSTLVVQVKGKYTHFTKFIYGSANASVAFDNPFADLFTQFKVNDIKVDTVIIINDTIMNVKITISQDAKSGYRNFDIQDSLSNYTNYGIYQAFWVGPYISSITPDTANVDDTVTIDMNCINTNFTANNIIKVWFNNFDVFDSNLVATKVVVKSPQLISATFKISPGTYQSLWDLYIADTSDGVFYKNKMLKIGESVSVKNNTALNTITLKTYPNPFNNDLIVNYNIIRESPVSFDVYDITGIKVYSQNSVNRSAGYYSEKLNAQKMNLNQGIYFLRLNVGNNYYLSKIIRL